MIQVTDEMNTAYWTAVNNATRTRSSASPHREGLAAVLAIVERDLPDRAPLAVEQVAQACPNCAPGYDCERGIYTPGGAQ